QNRPAANLVRKNSPHRPHDRRQHNKSGGSHACVLRSQLEHFRKKNRQVDGHGNKATKRKEVIQAQHPTSRVTQWPDCIPERFDRTTPRSVARQKREQQQPDREQDTKGPESPSNSRGDCDERRAKCGQRLSDISRSVHPQRETLPLGAVPATYESNSHRKTRQRNPDEESINQQTVIVEFRSHQKSWNEGDQHH